MSRLAQRLSCWCAREDMQKSVAELHGRALPLGCLACSGFVKRCHPAGSVTLPQGTEMVMPGDNITATFELISPVAMDPGLRFALREGGRTVGAGVVSKIIA